MTLVRVVKKHSRIRNGQCVLSKNVKYWGGLLNVEKHFYVERHTGATNLMEQLNGALSKRI